MLLPASAAVHARQNDKAPPLPTVIVQGDKAGDHARRSDTASKIVVGHAEIIRFGDTNVLDVLKRLPGITVSGGLRMRGMESGYVQVLINGETAPPGFSLESIAPHAIDRIEIIRSATAEYSTRAIAGTINIVLKRPSATLKRTAQAGAGTLNGRPSQQAGFQVANSDGRLAYALTGHLQQSRSASESRRSKVESDAAGRALAASQSRGLALGSGHSAQFSSRMTWNHSSRDAIGAHANLQTRRSNTSTSDDTDAIAGRSPDHVRQASAAAVNLDSLSGGINWTRKFQQGGRLELRATAGTSKRTSRALLEASGATEEQRFGRHTESEARETSFTSSGKYRGSGRGGHALVAGWESTRSNYRDTQYQASLFASSLPDGRITPYDQFDTSISRLSLFVQDEWNPSARISLYLGLRAEAFETGSEGAGLLPTTSRSAVTSPIVQTLWKLSADGRTQLRAALARTYKQPVLGNLLVRRTRGIENGPLKPDHQGNPALRPEVAWALDTSLEHFADDAGMVAASVFAKRIDNTIVRDVALRNGLWLSTPVNRGHANSVGIELEAKLSLKKILADGPDLELRFNANRNWSRVSYVAGPRNRLPGLSPGHLNLGADYRVNPRMSFGANYSIPLAAVSRTSPHETSGSRDGKVLDLYAQADLSVRARLRASVSNALRDSSHAHTRYTDQHGAREESSVSPSHAGVRVSLEYKLD